MSETRQYELVYVVSPEVAEDGVADLQAQVEGIVSERGGRIEKTDNWGRRRLAYAIGKHMEGTYVVNLIDGAGDIVKELNRRLRVMDIVLRHLVVRVDEDLRKAERAREKRQARRRATPNAPAAASAAAAPAEQSAPPPEKHAPAAEREDAPADKDTEAEVNGG